MNASVVQRELLSLSVEDFYGLWEVLWRVRNLYPERPDSELKEIAETAVRQLLSNGWIALYRQAGVERTEIRADEVDALLWDPGNWIEPTSKLSSVVIGATAAGERAYHTERG
jgi:hypothetical protein